MSDSGKIGVSKSYINHDIIQGKELGKFKTQQEAAKFASEHQGSELIFQKGEQFIVSKLDQKGTVYGKNSLSVNDLKQIDIDSASLTKQGIKNPVVSFVEFDDSQSDELIKIFQNADESTKEKISENQAINNPETLIEFSYYNNSRVKANVAENKSTPPEVLERLSKDSDELVRKSVAANSDTPVETLKSLSQDKNENVRMAIIANKSTPLNIIESLASDPKEWVRATVAINPRISKNTLENLAIDESPIVRTCAITNPKAPKDSMATLEKNFQESLKFSVSNNPATVKSISEKDLSWALNLENSIKNNNYESSMLEKVKYVGINEKVKVNAADNIKASSQILETLAGDPNPWIRIRVAANPKTPPAVLEKLSMDTDSQVRAVSAGRANISIKLLEKMANDPNILVKASVTNNPHISLKLLEKLSRDNNDTIRLIVACNPVADEKLLRRLLNDPAQPVRDEARKRLKDIEDKNTQNSQNSPAIVDTPAVNKDYPTQKEINDCMDLEKKVKDGYVPTKEEMDLYQDVATRLSKSINNDPNSPTNPYEQTPPPSRQVTSDEMDWALNVQQIVSSGEQVPQDVMDRYADIYNRYQFQSQSPESNQQ